MEKSDREISGVHLNIRHCCLCDCDNFVQCLYSPHYIYNLHLHYSDVIMSTIASRISSLNITQSFIQAQIKENIKTPRHWPCAGNSPATGEFPTQMATNAENVSIWWCHYERLNLYLLECMLNSRDWLQTSANVSLQTLFVFKPPRVVIFLSMPFAIFSDKNLKLFIWTR